MNGTRDYHTKWSKSEREKPISYINAYMWNLKKNPKSWIYIYIPESLCCTPETNTIL